MITVRSRFIFKRRNRKYQDLQAFLSRLLHFERLTSTVISRRPATRLLDPHPTPHCLKKLCFQSTVIKPLLSGSNWF